MTSKNEPDEKAEPNAAAVVEPEETPKMADITGVRYIGRANRKILTVEDFESLNVTGIKADLAWDASNNHFVLASDFNAAARDWFAAQPDFSIE